VHINRPHIGGSQSLNIQQKRRVNDIAIGNRNSGCAIEFGGSFFCGGGKGHNHAVATGGGIAAGRCLGRSRGDFD